VYSLFLILAMDFFSTIVLDSVYFMILSEGTSLFEQLNDSNENRRPTNEESLDEKRFVIRFTIRSVSTKP